MGNFDEIKNEGLIEDSVPSEAAEECVSEIIGGSEDVEFDESIMTEAKSSDSAIADDPYNEFEDVPLDEPAAVSEGFAPSQQLDVYSDEQYEDSIIDNQAAEGNVVSKPHSKTDKQRRKGKGDKKKFKMTWKKWVLVGIAAALIIGSVIAAVLMFSKPETPDLPLEYRTSILEKQALTESITVSGLVKSTNVVNVTTSVQDAKVSEILVQVGDTVKTGDVLFKLDDAEIKKKINDYHNANKGDITPAENYKLATSARKDAEYAKSDAYADYAALKSVSDSLYTPYKRAAEAVAPSKKAYDAAYKVQSTKGLALTEAMNARLGVNESDPKWAELNSAVESAQAAFDIAKADADSKKAIYEDTVSICDLPALESAYSSAQGETDSALSAYNAACSALERAQSEERVAKAALNSAPKDDTLKELQKQLDSCIIKAEAAGVVTDLRVTVGDYPSSDALMVIQDIDHLVLSTNIKEFDIPNVAVGQRVELRSDAVPGVILNGHVSMVSLTAGTNENMGGGVTFPAEITIDDVGTGLRVGMKAKADIITKDADATYTVPYEAIGYEENGDAYILVQDVDDPDEFDKVTVTLGDGGDFFVTIFSPKLYEGLVYRSSASDEGAYGYSGGLSGDFGMNGGDVYMDGGYEDVYVG